MPDNPYLDPEFGGPNANPYSDPNFGAPSSGLRRIADLGVSFARGLPQVGQTAYQLADVASHGTLDRASTGLTGAIADLATKAGDYLTGGKVGQVYGAGSTADMFKAPDQQTAPQRDMEGGKVSEGFDALDAAIASNLTPEQQAANQKVSEAEGIMPTLKAAWENPSAIVNGAVQSIPISLGMMGGVRVLAVRSGLEAASKIAGRELAYKELASAGPEAQKAFSTAVEHFAEGKGGMVAQAGTDFITSGAQQAADAKKAIEDMPEETLQKSPMYQQLRQTMSAEEARNAVASNGQFRAFLAAGTLSAMTSPITSKLEGKAATAGLRDAAASKSAKAFLGIKESALGYAKAAGGETLQETLQSAGEQLGTNIGVQAADPDQDLMKGVANQGITGGLAGGLMGVGFHAIGSHGAADTTTDTPPGGPLLALPAPPVTTASGVTIDPSKGPMQAAAALALRNGTTPALPGPDTPFPNGPIISGPDGVSRPATYADMTRAQINIGREADDLSSSRHLTDNHLQHAVNLGLTYPLDVAQQVAAIHEQQSGTPMTVVKAPNGAFAPMPKVWVSPQHTRENAEYQMPRAPSRLQGPGTPTGRLTTDSEGVTRPDTAGDRQQRDARAATDLASGNTADVRRANAKRLATIVADRRAKQGLEPIPEVPTTTEGATDARDEETRQAPDAGRPEDHAEGLSADGERGADDRVDRTDGNERGADERPASDDAGRQEEPAPENPVREVEPEPSPEAAPEPAPALAPEPAPEPEDTLEKRGAFLDTLPHHIRFRMTKLAGSTEGTVIPSPLGQAKNVRILRSLPLADLQRHAEQAKADFTRDKAAADAKRVADEAAEAAKPSKQFDSYAKAINAGLTSPGMLEQIRLDERLKDGESDKLLALHAERRAVAEEDAKAQARVDATNAEVAARRAALEAQRRAEAIAKQEADDAAAAAATKEKADADARMQEARERVREAYRKAQADAFEGTRALDLTEDEDLAATLKRWITERAAVAEAGEKAAMEVLAETPDDLAPIVKQLEKERKRQLLEKAKEAKAEADKPKLVNTGVDLRRHWELVKAQKRAAEDADGTTAMNGIFAAMQRADLWRVLAPDATPGLVKLHELARAQVQTFKEFAVHKLDRAFGSYRWSGRGASTEAQLKAFLSGETYLTRDDPEWARVIGYDKADVKFVAGTNVEERFPNSGDGTVDQRLQVLRNIADEYLALTTPFIKPFEGQKEIRPMLNAWGDAIMAPGTMEKYPKDAPGGYWKREPSRVVREAAAVRLVNTGDLRSLHPDGNIIETLLEKESTLEGLQKKASLTPPRIVTPTRTGLAAVRTGDVSPQQFKDHFGFADIGFGSWVKSKEDQTHLNAAFDAFADLAAFMGMDPKNIGFGGRLHFTLGALGRGAKAAATFHPGHPMEGGGVVQVINLTKTKGDGTVAHEWFHALDHFMRRFTDTSAAGGMRMSPIELLIDALKNQAPSVATLEAAALRGLRGQSWMRNSKREGPMANAIGLIDYYSRLEETAYFKAAKELDGGSLKNPYWANNAELPARAFEAYIGDNLGGENNYLVNTAWSGAGMATPPKYRGTPYPMRADRDRFAPWFKALLSSIEWKSGMPEVNRAKFLDLRPDEMSERRAAVADVKARVPEMMEQIEREKEAAKNATANAAAAKQRAALLAAEAEQRERDAANPPATPEPTGSLSTSDLSDLFDAALDDVQAETQRNPEVPDVGVRAQRNQTPPTSETRTKVGDQGGKTVDPKAAQLIAEAAKQGVKGIDEALSGLTKLFGGGKLQSFPGGFDEKSYAEAKPHFEAALKAFQAAGKSLKDLFKLLIQQFGAGVKPYAIRFAQDMKLTAELGGDPKPADKLAKWVSSRLIGIPFKSDALFTAADEAYGGTQAEGKYTPKDAYDAVELAINRRIAADPAFAADVSKDKAVHILKALDAMVKTIPTQTKRTQEQNEYQQFSTVPQLAYLANWVADTKAGETVLEPSAGIGGLAAFAQASGATVVVNELSSRRAELLRMALPEARVFTENAEHINDVLPDDVRPTVILMNPPFSATAGRVVGERSTMNGAMHVESALARLAPGGRLVAIVGNGMDAGKPAFADWWKKIEATYTVRANLNLNGAEYVKYGTSFDNNLLVIDKTGPTTGRVVTGRIEQYDLLPAVLEPIKATRHALSLDDRAPERDRPEQPGGGTTVAPGLAGAGDAERPSAGAVGAGAGDQRGDTGGNVGGGRRGGGSTDADAGNGPGGRAPGSGNGRARNDGAGAGRRQVGEGSRDDGAGVDQGVDRKVGTEVALGAQAAPSPSSELSDSIFEAYRPLKAVVQGSKPHPTPLVESAAMSAVEPLAVTYTPNLPKATVTGGLLSDAQLESVIYAGQAHQEMLPSGERRGFFIGDGTGVGKGREISGIILDNQRQGRDKHIWISAKAGLVNDARRDFTGVGADPADIFELSDTAPKDSVKSKRGVMFTTYDTLRGGEKKNANEKDAKVRTRLEQIIEWAGPDYDGTLVFDEAHKMGNLGSEGGPRGGKEASKMALAGLELQNKLPKARIVYVSATGATEVSNLMYGTRLGIWGPNTAFENSLAFATNIQAAGLASMELVARDLKAQGSYIARSLSFDGVGYERLDVPLTDLQTTIYDELAKAWQGVLQNVEEAMEHTKANKNSNAKAAARSQFWGTHQRFFNQIITSMQTPAIIDRAQKEIAAGNAVLFQLVNTNEATQERAADKAKAEGIPLEELDFSPRQVLIEYVKRAYPVAKYEERTDPATGKVTSVPVMDSEGKPVFDKSMMEKRDALVKTLDTIRVPDNPIDLILKALGPSNVAEVTGRSRRFEEETDKHGNLKLVERKRGSAAAAADAQAFQADKRQAIIFSDAGGTGYSFHADRTAKNQRPRVHILLQAGWRADAAVQGFGRSHRSNQANAPTYLLPTTNLKAQRRFISSIARRLDQLGALTKGQRNTGSQGLFTNRDNLESKYATAALSQLIDDMAPTSGVEMQVLGKRAPLFIKAMGLDGIYSPESGAVIESKRPPITQFLNRLLSLTTSQQDELFTEFENRMDASIDAAVKAGTFDDGMQTVRATSVAKVRDETVYIDPRSNARTRYVELAVTNPASLNTWDDALTDLEDRSRDQPIRFYQNTSSGRVFAVTGVRETLDLHGQMKKRGYRVQVQGTGGRVLGSYIDNVDTIENSGRKVRRTDDGAPFTELAYRPLNEEAARSLWDLQYAAAPKEKTEPLHILTGVLLPVWDRLQTEGFQVSASVVRTQTSDGEKLIGRVLPDATRPAILKNFGVGALPADISTSTIVTRILAGEKALLANGWQVVKSRVAGDPRLELIASSFSRGQQDILKQQGAFIEQIAYRDRVFIPTGPGMDRIFDAITKDANRPVIDLVKPEKKGDEDVLHDVRPIFYSQLQRAMEKAPFSKAGDVNVGQLRMWLAARAKDGTIKADEVAATGLDDYLKLQDGKVTAEQVRQFLANNGVKVTETMLGGGELEGLPDGWHVQEMGEGDSIDGTDRFAVINDEGETVATGETEQEAQENAMDYDARADSGPKYEKHTLPGGRDYRELLLTLPDTRTRTGGWATIDTDGYINERFDSEAEARAAAKREGLTWNTVRPSAVTGPEPFRTGHFEQTNILAHVRFNERTDADGKRVLFIEELQSDWAQRGREKGFQGAAPARVTELPEGWSFERQNGDNTVVLKRRGTMMAQRTLQYWDDAASTKEKAIALYNEVQASMAKGDRVPAGPFVQKTEAWVALAVKRMIRYAADHGFDRVAFVNGEQSAARYDLRQQVSRIIYEKNADGTFKIGVQAADRPNSGFASSVGGTDLSAVPAEKLADYLGKDVAERIVNGEGKSAWGTLDDDGRRILEGEDLQVGGEGMRAFYDKIVPNVVNDVLKKLGGGRLNSSEFTLADRTGFGATLREEGMAETSSQQGFDVTPELRTKVEAGLPLFTDPAAAISSDLDGRLLDDVKAGATAQALLQRIARESTSAVNRALAEALIKAGVRSKVSIAEMADGAVFGDQEAAAAYHPGSDRVELSEGPNAEKHLLHELVHAATVRAIRSDSKAAADLRALLRSIRESGAIDPGLYGLKNEAEFIAEAFSNPDFQAALQAIPQKGLFRNAWDRFVDMVRRVLGLSNRTALDEAMRVGAQLMRETTALNEAGNVGSAIDGDVLHDVTYKAIQQNVYDWLKSPDVVSWWQKTVGTQYHKAQTHPLFKPVFDIGQRFLQDTSQIAMNAANLAPNLLPKMGTARDVLRSLKGALRPGEATKDHKAIAVPIFQGTLTDKKVYSDDELRAQFKLNDRQIGLYREFRKATNRSLDEVLTAVAAQLGKGVADPRVIAEAKARPWEGAKLIADAIRERDPKLAAKIDGQIGKIIALKGQGYAPLMRFGNYTVYVVGPNGEQEYFGMFESKREMNRMAREMQEQYPNATVTMGTRGEMGWQLFQGVSPDVLEVFAEALGVDQTAVFQEYLKKAVNNRNALTRLIKRKGVAGYSEDVPRVLASFVTSSARAASKAYNIGDLISAANAIPKDLGTLQDEAVALAKYLQNPQEEAGKLRGFLFVHFLGGSIASAITNMTQPILQTLPYLSQWGTARAGAELARAAKMATVGGIAEPALAKALKRAELEGTIAPHELHQLYAETDSGGLGSNPVVAAVAKTWGSFFSLAESFNRKATFIAAFRMAQDFTAADFAKAGVADAYGFAEKAIHETQGIYNRGNRPNWARGAVGATVFTFKQFSVSYLEFVKRLPRKQQVLALAILVMAAGAQGLPFAEDIEDMIDTLGQSLGYATNSKRALRKALSSTFLGEEFGNFITGGASALPGVPLDWQGRLGMSNLIPGTSLFKRSSDDKLKEAFEVLGPVGSLVTSITNAVSRGQTGDWQGIFRMGAPVAVQNMLKAVDMMQTGSYRDSKGRSVEKTDNWDAFIKGIGFQPSDVAQKAEKVYGTYQDTQLNSVVRSQITERWARGAFEKDPAMVADAIAAMRDWNEKNPTMRITITPQAIRQSVQQMAMTADVRAIKHAPKAMRAEVAAAVR
jgi:predicted RNA methylase